jgi:hypothetical protein
MNWHGLRLSALSLLLICAACSSKNGNAGTATDAEEQGTSLASRDVETPASSGIVERKDLDELVDVIVAEANDLPRAEFDPSALANKLGNDPQAHFAWVRDHTWWAPYRGLLRGSKGVMLDRIGSNLDRAVLLGDLLRHSGYEVRLAHAELPEARARELLDRIRPIPAERRVPFAPNDMPADRRRAMTALMPNLEQETEREHAVASRTRAEAEALVRAQSEMLLAAVREAASSDGSIDSDDSEAILALKDHWWIERKVGATWVPMDVLLPDVAVGNVLAAASSISAWEIGDAFPAVPESSWHSVQIRVVVERYEAGATSESTVLEALLHPAKYLERPIRLGHMPRPWPGDLSDPSNPAALREAALAVREWVPYIQVDDDLIVQSGFSIQGELQSNPLESGDIGKVGGAEVASGMDMALGGFGVDEAVPAATAEWLDYEIRMPGSPPQRLRRQVFDLLGPARRTAKSADFDGTADLRKLERFEALFGHTDILLQPCDFTDEFVAWLFAAGVIANQAAIREVAQESDPAKARYLASEILERMPPWSPLPSLVLWRSALSARSGDAFLDRPNVLSYRIGQAVVDADEPRFYALIDIGSNATGARMDAHRSPFEVRLQQGVADTVAEMLVLGNELRMAENTASIFAHLASEGSRGMLIPARDLSAASALPWPEDEAARVGADVGSGYLVVVPRKAVLLNGQQRVGWWRVDPASGETIGVMDNGFHAAGTEDAVTRARAALRVLRTYEKKNRGHIRKVLQNPNSFPNQKVQFYRRLTRLLYDLDHGLAVL